MVTCNYENFVGLYLTSDKDFFIPRHRYFHFKNSDYLIFETKHVMKNVKAKRSKTEIYYISQLLSLSVSHLELYTESVLICLQLQTTLPFPLGSWEDSVRQHFVKHKSI